MSHSWLWQGRDNASSDQAHGGQRAKHYVFRASIDEAVFQVFSALPAALHALARGDPRLALQYDKLQRHRAVYRRVHLREGFSVTLAPDQEIAAVARFE